MITVQIKDDRVFFHVKWDPKEYYDLNNLMYYHPECIEYAHEHCFELERELFQKKEENDI